MKSYIIQMSLLTLVLMLILFVVDNFVFGEISLLFGYWVIFIFSLITQITHHFLLNLLKTKPNKFPLWYPLASMSKMFIYFVVALVYLLLNREQSVAFLICYVLCYLIFLIAETTSMSSIVRIHKTKVNN